VAVWQRRGWLATARFAIWAGMAVCHVVLVVLHRQMDRGLEPATFTIRSRPHFRSLHEGYLAVSTVQWALGLLLLTLTVLLWRRGPATLPTEGPAVEEIAAGEKSLSGRCL